METRVKKDSTPFHATDCCPATTEQALQRAYIIAPELEAVVGSHDRMTFEELYHEVQLIKKALWGMGVRHGDHVAICDGNCPRWVAIFLALGGLGAVTVPINTRLKNNEISYTLKQAKVKFLFIVDIFLKIDFTQILRSICPAVDSILPDSSLPDLQHVILINNNNTTPPKAAISWNNFLSLASSETPLPESQPGDTVLIQYTSGTTASPKGVLLTHQNLLVNGYFAGVRMGLRTGDRVHSARPFFHVAGTSQSILACLQHTATLVTMDRFLPDLTLQLMEKERCTHFSANDTMALMLLDHPDRAQYKLNLRGAWLAATPAVARRVVEELGAVEAVMAYGQSEASPNVALSCCWESLETRISGHMRLQPGIEVRICDDSGNICPPVTIGEIQVRGWNVMQGYFEKTKETSAVLSDDGWLSTGDQGCLHEDGRLQFIGRCKDMIRVGGENVAPADIEEFLKNHIDVKNALIVGVPHPRLIEVPAAFVILQGEANCSSEDLLEWCRSELAGFKVPHYLEIVDDFNFIGMTASSKIKKNDLRKHAIKLFDLEENDKKN